MISLNVIILMAILCFFISIKIKYFEKLGVIYLIIISSIRYNYGGDFAAYYNYFININDPFYTPFFNFELGYYLLNKILRSFSSNFSFFLLIVSGFNIFTFYFFIKKYFLEYTSHLMILFVIGYYSFLFQLVIIRQSIATSIFLISIIFLIEKNIYKYFLCIIVASLFHKPVIIMLIIYIFTYDFIYKRKNFFLFVSILLILYFLPNKIYIDLFNLLQLNKYSLYFKDNTLTINYYFILYLISSFFVQKNIIRNNSDIRLYFILGLFYNYFRMWSVKGEWLERIAFYMVYPYIIYLYFSFKVINKQLLIILYIFFYFKYNVICYSKLDNYFYAKYRRIYSEEKLEYEKMKSFKTKRDLNFYRMSKYPELFKRGKGNEKINNI